MIKTQIFQKFWNGWAILKWNQLTSKFKFRKKNSKVIKIKSGRSRSIKDIFTLSHVNPARFKSLEMRSFLVISDQVNSGHFLINFLLRSKVGKLNRSVDGWEVWNLTVRDWTKTGGNDVMLGNASILNRLLPSLIESVFCRTVRDDRFRTVHFQSFCQPSTFNLDFGLMQLGYWIPSK